MSFIIYNLLESREKRPEGNVACVGRWFQSILICLAVSPLLGRTAVSTGVSNKRGIRSFSVLVRWRSVTSKDSSRGFLGCDTVYWCGKISTARTSMMPASSGLSVTTRNNWKILLITLHVSSRLGKANLLISSPTELLC